MPIDVGEMPIHNYRLTYAAGLNISDDFRIRISMHFMPPETKQIVVNWDCDKLVQENEFYNNFKKPQFQLLILTFILLLSMKKH